MAKIGIKLYEYQPIDKYVVNDYITYEYTSGGKYIFEVIVDTIPGQTPETHPSKFKLISNISDNNFVGVLYNTNTFVDNNDGTITLPNLIVSLFDDQNYSGTKKSLPVTGGDTGTDFPHLADGATNYIYVDYNSGSPEFVISQTEPNYRRSDLAKYLTVYRDGNNLHVLDWEYEASGLPNKILDRLYEVNKFVKKNGSLKIALASPSLIITIGQGVVYNGIKKNILPSINSNDDVLFRLYHTAGQWDKTVFNGGASINNTDYDNGNNLTPLSNNHYVVNWYYRDIENNNHIYEVIGRNQYTKLSDAELEQEPPLPQLVTNHTILVGKIIIQKNSTSGNVYNYESNTFIPSQAVLHNELDGLNQGNYIHLTQSEYNSLKSYKKIFLLMGA
jgi:hypothetical protein